MFERNTTTAPVTIEQVRKKARVLVIDDLDFPYQTMFTRDGYHFERWATIVNLSQLVDGHFDLILLDIQGVGLEEDPQLEGLGILKYIKETNPAQMVILYSAQPQSVSSLDILMLADAVLEKGINYTGYVKHVDDLLMRRTSPAYFISTMNQALGDHAYNAPKAVIKAKKALRRRNVAGFKDYMQQTVLDRATVDTAVGIIALGISAGQLAVAL